MMTYEQRTARAIQKASEQRAHVLAVAGREGVYQVRSASDPSERYYLTAKNAAHIECSCRAASYQLPCWHVEKLRSRLIREASRQAQPASAAESAADLLYGEEAA